MATRKYSCNPQDMDHAVVGAAGAATTARIEMTVDWDTMATDGLSGQQARLQVKMAMDKIYNFIETLDKFNVKA